MRVTRDTEVQTIEELRRKHGIVPLAELEQEMLSTALVAAGFNESLAAKLVGLSRNTFVRRVGQRRSR
jgi:transcriptional regulator of acetoin/glycerol metabolism